MNQSEAKRQVRAQLIAETGLRWCATCYAHRDALDPRASFVLRMAGRTKKRMWRCGHCNRKRAEAMAK